MKWSFCVEMTEESDTVSRTVHALLLNHYANARQIFKRDTQQIWKAAPRTQNLWGPCINLGSADCVHLNSCRFASARAGLQHQLKGEEPSKASSCFKMDTVFIPNSDFNLRIFSPLIFSFMTLV